MNKKLLAVAVAGVLAAPAAALAQSSVTISGVFKASFDSYSVSNFNNTGVTAAPARGTNPGNKSETRITDDSSAIRFNVVEDLGGGLQAIGQLDWRVTMDHGGDAANGNNHVGLRSKTWGRVFLGRQDLHYFNRESNLTVRGTLKGDSISLLAFAKGGTAAIANASRTPNVIHYTTPNWGGFTMIAAYSTNPNNAGQSPLTQLNGSTSENDVGNGSAVTTGTTRKGDAWHFNPNFEGRNFQVGYSYWKAKPDVGSNQPGVLTIGTTAVACGPTNPGALTSSAVPPCVVFPGLAVVEDQRADRLYGSFRWAGFHFGLAWDKSKLRNVNTGTETSDRQVWSFPIEYTWGNHGVYGHYTVAKDDKAIADPASGGDQSAKMYAITYGYGLSKRTTLALTYAQIKNSTGAAYNLFTSTGFLGTTSGAVLAGEDPRTFSATIRHAF